MNLEELIYFLANKTLNSTEQRMAVLAENSLERRIDIYSSFLKMMSLMMLLERLHKFA